jgi:TPR repeat protein
MSLEPKDCRWPWNRLYVQVDGEIKPCCYSMFSLGNVEKSSDIDGIWHGEQMKNLRMAITKNEIHPICAGAGCAYVRSQIPDNVMVKAKYRGSIDNTLADITTRRLALLGNRQAAVDIGLAYRTKRVDTFFARIGNLINSIIWRERAIRAGHFSDACELAKEYRSGEFRHILAWRGVQLLEIACKNQYQAAFAPLGYHHHKAGRSERALKIFQQGMELNDPDSIYWISLFYKFGVVLKKDPEEAQRLYDLAIRRGSALALAAL